MALANGQYGPEALIDAAGNARTTATVAITSPSPATGYTATVSSAGNLTITGPPGLVTYTVKVSGTVVDTETVLVPVLPSDLSSALDALAAAVVRIATLEGAAVSIFNPRGAWAQNTAYAKNDVTSNFGSSFICLVAHTSSTTGTGPSLTTPGSNWMILASKGPAGDAGPAGDTGATGADGQDGQDGAGVLVLAQSATIPASTPSRTIIVRYGNDQVAAGVASTDTFTLAAHGLSNGNLITPTTDGPAPLTRGDEVYIVQATSSTFKVSQTSGGAAVDITADGNLRYVGSQ